MIGVVISQKLWLPVAILMSATLAVCGLIVSGCSFAEDNVGAVNQSPGAPASTPQVPESMKTNDVTGEGGQPPPQGIY
jgi:hypothetical protein